MTDQEKLTAIVQATAEHYRLPVEALHTSASHVAKGARNVAMWIAYKLCRISTADIAKAFNLSSPSGVWMRIDSVDKKRTQVDAIETIRERLGLESPVYFLHEFPSPDLRGCGADSEQSAPRRPHVAPVEDGLSDVEPTQVPAPCVRPAHRFHIPSSTVWQRSRVTVPGSASIVREAVS